MPINAVKDRKGRSRWEFEFSRRLGGRRLRTRKLLPPSWTRTQADAFDRKESARLYAQLTGVEEQRWTIDQAVARYVDERIPVLKTGLAIGAELQSLQEYFIGRAVADLPEVCAEISEDYRDDVAPATLMNKLRYLCAAARWGWKWHNMATSNPAGRVIFPSVRNERQVYVNRRQMVQLARACANRPARAAIRIAFYSGMRLGEIERAERVSELGAFLLLDTKNGEPRMIPMAPKIRACAAIDLGTRFQTGYHFRKARALVGLEHLHFHDLRHSTASAMRNAGVDLRTVGDILGHKSLQSTQRYAHLGIEAARAALAKIDGRATSSPSPSPAGWPKPASSPMEARAGVEPTYSDLQSRKRA
jgi:integrase